MIKLKVTTTNDFPAVKKQAQGGILRSIQHAAASLRLIVRRSIRRRKKPSSPGTPPSSPTGRLRESIRYELVDGSKYLAHVGPARSVIGPAGQPHEFGGSFRDESYPDRPYMRPGLEAILPRMPEEFRGLIK
jgi:hypothetical protein